MAFQTPRRLRAVALAACPGAVAAALALVFLERSESLKAPSVLAVGSMTMPLLEKVTSLPGTLFSARGASWPLLVASLAAMGLFARERGTSGEDPPVHWVVTLRAARFAVLAAALLGLYFVMPMSLSGATLVHQRFLAPAFAVAALAAPRRGGETPRWAPWLAACPVVMLAATLGGFVEQDASYRDLDRVLAVMEDGSAVAQLDLTPREPGPMAPVVGAASRALAVHGGRMLFTFLDAPTLPVKMPKEYQWNEPVLRLAPTPFAFLPEHDLSRFRYALVYEKSRAMDDVLGVAFSPEARLIAHAGPWLLFESTLPVVPLTSPDAPLPSPEPETLALRVRRALGR